jgi:hypothetical protein
MRLVPFIRRVLLALLTLNAAVRSADAQALRCSAILPGETVSRVAMRMTGSAEYRHQPWFQVVVPDTGTLIAKSSYDDVQAGWRACLMSAHGASRHPTPSPSAAAFFGVPIRWLNGANLELLLLADLGVALVLFWIAVDKYSSQRQRTVRTMTEYAEQFLREFKRPLIDPVLNVAPVRSRVQVSPVGSRLEICLAPADGKRYPNLSDHKDNVTYDVGRIVRSLHNPSFLCLQMYAKGAWVVIPFQFHGNANKEGPS